MVVVGKSEIGVSVAVDVSYRAALRVVAIRNFVRLPSGTEPLRIFEPPNSIYHPASSHHIRCAVVVHIDRPLTAIRDELAKNTHFPILMPNPLSSIRAGILVPVRATDEIRA